MKKFVKEFGGADLYENLAVQFIGGHNPDLVVFDERGKELKRIDLTTYDNTDNIHVLMIQEGFVKKTKFDQSPSCAEWARQGECQKNPGYMLQECKISCAEKTTDNMTKKIELR